MIKWIKSASKFISIFIVIIQFQFCSDQSDTVHWPKNGTSLSATKYRLDIADTANILINKDNLFTLIKPHDSLITSQFQINYSAIAEERQKYFLEANQKVTNTQNPNVTEYYKFEDGNVFLLGYKTKDEVKPFTIFEPPLIISGKENGKDLITEGTMKTFDSKLSNFDEGFKTTLKIKNSKEILLANNKETKHYLRELIMARDATVGFGENNLIMPEAIMFKSKIITDINGVPIAEWSIKADIIEAEQQQLQQEPKMQEHKLYIEFTKYYNIDNN